MQTEKFGDHSGFTDGKECCTQPTHGMWTHCPPLGLTTV